MDAPPIQYARTADGVRIAYAVFGGGDALPVILLAPIPGSAISEGRYWTAAEGIAADRAAVLYDRRGVGSSQRGVADLTLEALALDIAAVADACGFERFVLWSRSTSSLIAIQYAATRPERCAGLMMGQPTAVGSPNDKLMLSLLSVGPDWAWASEAMVLAIAGSIERVTEFLAGVALTFQRSHHPDDLRRQLEVIVDADVRHLLANIRAPTIIGLSEVSAVQRAVEGVYDVAAGIAGAQLVGGEWGAMEGGLPLHHDFLRSLDGHVAAPPRSPSRAAEAGAFRAILFTDLAAHTAMMERLGDEAGRQILREHEQVTRSALAAHGGTEVKTMGDGFMASFRSVSESLRCAQALQRAFERPLSSGYRLHVRIGINAGEPIDEDHDLFGTSVIVAARTAASAGGGQIVVTDVVRQLVAGKEFLFADRGLSTLKGLEEPIRTWEVLW